MKKLPFRQTLLAAAIPVLLSPLAHAGVGYGITTDPGFTTAGNPAYPTYTMPTFYANSDFPTVTTSTVGGVTTSTFVPGLRKFVDSLAPLGCGTTNNLGQCIPVAVPNTPYPATVGVDPTKVDYYEIGIVEYTEKMHSDLPATSAVGAAVPTYTHLRGYVQLVPAGTAGAVALTEADGVTPMLRTVNGVANTQIWGLTKPHYLGPVIAATKGRAVRVKYTNLLPVGKATNAAGTGAPVVGLDATGQYNRVTDFKRNGDLFIPYDDTLTGAGLGPTAGAEGYRQNRAEIHLHGSHSPWISDGTPHQWTVPLGDTAAIYKKGDSFQNVPDMADPGQGSGTLFWTSDQSARLMFYHDHTVGETRLNVYVGEAAGYVLSDPVEQALTGTLPAGVANPGGATPIAAVVPGPANTIPLIIQDKTFVPKDVAMQDAKWDTNAWGKPGDLWFPHVYETNQDPASADGTNPVGRWDWGPWFWPVFTSSFGLPSGEYGQNNVTTTPEAFMDTPVVNGTVYPNLTVQPTAYRFRILNAANDRMWNLGLYQAEPLSIGLASLGIGYTNPTVTITAAAGDPGTGATANALMGLTDVTLTWPANGIVQGSAGYTVPPTVTITAPPPGGIQATAVALLEPIAAGQTSTYIKAILITNPGDGYIAPPTITITPATADTKAVVPAATAIVGLAGIQIVNPGSGYLVAPTVTINDPTGTGAVAVASVNTEVKMVPFSTQYVATTPPTPNGHGSFPISGGLQGTGWGQMDNRLGGVPDPALAGPDIIQIGSESGLLPNPVTIPSTPINYEYNKRSVTVLNVLERGLFLGNAERADVVIDFSQYAGKTLILYNDAPAPVPASDPRIDYYTGNPDMTDSGGAPSTLPGYGPNTRTVMRIQVAGTTNGTAYNTAALATNLPIAYKAGQDAPIVPEPGYAPAYGASTDPTIYGGINTGSAQSPYFSFTAGSAAGTGAPVASLSVKTGGTGYKTAPTVTIAAPSCTPDPITCVQATATSSIAGGMVNGFTMTNSGAGYTSAPSVVLSGGSGLGATATANLGVVAGGPVTKTYPVYNKAIQELFEPTFGRMNATLGVELPLTNNLNQTTVPLAYIDPVTETVSPGEVQIWKITHNGVDTHPVHFHLVDVQVINRVGWDGTIKEPYANELGWKETVKMNPLEDILVAVKARAVDTSAFGFGLPQSNRLLDPSLPVNSTLGFTQVNFTGTPIAVSTNPDGTVVTNAAGNPVANPAYNANFGQAVAAGTVKNVMTNYDNEYVWHCHILGHEENDFMRSLVFHPAASLVTAPAITAPLNSSLLAVNALVNLTWTDPNLNEVKYTVERSVNGGAFTALATLPANSTSYAVAGGIPANTSWTFRISAVGASNTASSTVLVTTNALKAATWAVAPTLPVNLLSYNGGVANGSRVLLSFTDNAIQETTYQVQQCSANCGVAASWTTVPAANVVYTGATVGAGTGAATATVTTTLNAASYMFRLTPMNGATAGTVSANSVAMSTALAPAPAAPNSFTAVKSGANALLNWVDAANNNAGNGTTTSSYVIQVQQVSTAAGGAVLVGWTNIAAAPALLGNVQTATLSYAANIPFAMKLLGGATKYYQFRIASTGPGGSSGNVQAAGTVAFP